MKAKKSWMILGLVTIAAIAAGTVIGVNIVTQKQKNPLAPAIVSLKQEDNNKTVSLKVGDKVNLTLPDYGDGGYVWNVVHNDSSVLSQTEYFTWGSSGLLGDFGKDTWLFTAIHAGSMTLELRCQRPFGDQESCQSFIVTITVQ
jgi:predicted secreted protein